MVFFFDDSVNCQNLPVVSKGVGHDRQRCQAGDAGTSEEGNMGGKGILFEEKCQICLQIKKMFLSLHPQMQWCHSSVGRASD